MMNIVNTDKQYKTDSYLVYSCQYHVIFTTKFRRKVITEEIAADLKRLILEKQAELKYEVIDMEVMEDHVHLLLNSNPKLGIYRQMKRLKGYTSNILRTKYPSLRTRVPTLWTYSKFISTVGSVSLDVVKKYIESQKNV